MPRPSGPWVFRRLVRAWRRATMEEDARARPARKVSYHSHMTDHKRKRLKKKWDRKGKFLLATSTISPTRKCLLSCRRTKSTPTTMVANRRIEWTIKTTNQKRRGVDPACSVFDLKEATFEAVL
ncbi:hypothetical protein TELCIR_19770 [Teladorsagia circumcincta]|uniref:Uncharacterized protein n=1 Tax=Teladorsagia circumcincta TaxID=45464 RepID=A0A2G9TLG4_TELCI|nr:hypothetical protein TELCIR_19770 [Teladorsagia circumcincta]